jgi:acyl carrier protein
MSQEDLSRRLIAFIREQFLGGDPRQELNETTPLLEWGVLTSMNTVRLVAFLREGFGAAVPPAQLSAQNFKDVRSITSMVLDLVGAPGA